MKKSSLAACIAVPLLSFAFAGYVLVADIPSTPVENGRIDDDAAGKKAIKAKSGFMPPPA